MSASRSPTSTSNSRAEWLVELGNCTRSTFGLTDSGVHTSEGTVRGVAPGPFQPVPGANGQGRRSPQRWTWSLLASSVAMRQSGTRVALGLGSLLVATACFRATQNMALTTFALLGRAGVGLGPATIGGLASLSTVVTVAITVSVAARLPLRWSATGAMAGIFLLIPALLLFAGARSVALFTGGSVALGLAGGLAFPALTTAVGHLGRDRQERALALYSLTLSASLAVGPLVESVVLAWRDEDIRAPFVAFLAFPILAVIVLASRLTGRHAPRSRAIDSPAAEDSCAQAPSPMDTAVLTGGRASLGRDMPESWTDHPDEQPMTVRALRMTPARVLSQFLDRSLLGSPGWRVAVTGQLLYAVPFAVITVFGALMARVAFGATPAMAQLAFTAFFVTSFAARTGVVWRTPIARKLRLLWLSGGLTAVGLILLGFGHGLGLLLVAMSVLGVPHGITFPIALAQAAESSNPAGLARANAGLLAAMGLTSVVAPPIMGGLLPATGYRGMMLLLLIPVGILASLLWMQRDYPGSVTDFPQVGQVKS